MKLPARIDVLRLRNFRNLFIGQTVSVFGDGLIAVALTFAVLDLTGSGTDVGLVLAAASLPLLLLTLVGGVWADRLRREWVMIVSDLVRCVMLAISAALLFSGHAQIWNLCVLGFVYGCADAFFFPAFSALVPQIVPADRLQEANALRGMSDSLGWFVGPAVAGILVAAIGSSGAIALDAATFLVSAAFLLTLRVPPLVRTVAAASFVSELAHGWREVRSRTWLWTMMLRAMLVLFVTIAPLQVLGPLALTEQGYGAALWGLLTGLFSLGMLLGGLFALYVRPRRPMVTVALTGTTAAAPMIALAMGLSRPWLIVVWFGRGIAIGVLIAVWEATLGHEIPGESLARVSSWDWMTANGLWWLGLVIAGPVAAAMGLTEALWLAGVLGVLFSMWALLVPDVWRLRRREAAADATSAPPSPAA